MASASRPDSPHFVWSKQLEGVLVSSFNQLPNILQRKRSSHMHLLVILIQGEFDVIKQLSRRDCKRPAVLLPE